MAGYVLIVESNVDLQKQIGGALREAGYELAAETEAAWAKRSIAVRSPDVVVLGTRLGDGDGFRLAEELRGDPDTRAVPILFVASTHRGASHRAEARRRFAPAEYLLTPLDVAAIVPRMNDLVARGPVAPPPAADEEQTPAPDAIAAKASLRDPVQQRERRDVERSAKNLVADQKKAAFAGTLKRTPFPRLLQRLYTERATGSLLLLKDPTKKIVAFAGGYPVSVRSNVANETLGQILLEKRLITAEALSESVARMLKEKRQQGQILIEMGALSPFNLEQALVDQLEAKLFEIFSWGDAKFMFKAGEAPAASAIRLERPPAAIILEGIRRHYDDARQKAALDRYAGQYVALASDPLLRLQEMTADPTELAFIRSIDGQRQLEEILNGAEISPEKARLLLVALSESGMVQPIEATARTRRSGPPTPTDGTPRRRGVTPAPPAADGTGRRKAPAATAATAAAAATVTPAPAPAPAPPPADDGVPTATPPASTAPLSSGQLSMMLQTARTQDFFWVLGVEREAAAAEIDRAYEALARSFHADRYRLATDDDRKTAQEVFDRLTEAHQTLRDATKRRGYVAKLARATGVEAEPPTPEGPVAPAMPPGAAVPSPSNAAARALYEAGLEHLRARRHHEAVEALRQAARLIPNEADYRAALGWALFRQAPADARAGRAAVAELRRALQIDERNRNAAQRLAEIYAQTGQPELAVQELERLLTLDPGDMEVADELRRLRAR
jgi:DNA-binding response OmpR family regulator/tetratricopeptide (TPR) repeat protein